MKFKYVFIWKKNIDSFFHFSKVFHKGSAFLAMLLKNKKQICYYALELHFKTGSAVFGSISMEFNS